MWSQPLLGAVDVDILGEGRPYPELSPLFAPPMLDAAFAAAAAALRRSRMRLSSGGNRGCGCAWRLRSLKGSVAELFGLVPVLPCPCFGLAEPEDLKLRDFVLDSVEVFDGTPASLGARAVGER